MLRLYLKTIINSFTSFLFPEYCLGCRKQGQLLCLECITKIPKAEDPELKNVYSCFHYQDRRVRAAVQLLKYKNSRSLGAVFGAALREHALEVLAEEQLFDGSLATEPWIIIPVPLSQERLRTRGYNQAELIGHGLLLKKTEEFFIMDTDVLYKGHHTESQVDIKDRKSRLANPRGSFAVRNRERIAKRNCIVIDDVVTTGATIQEAMRSIKHAGARRVLGLSVAH